MNWWILVAAGLLEVVWATGLKFTDGFTRPFPSLLTLLAMGISFYLLSLAVRELPLGTAYSVWVGIGAIGSVIAGIVLFGETITPGKIVSLILVLVGIAGLRWYSVPPTSDSDNSSSVFRPAEPPSETPAGQSPS